MKDFEKIWQKTLEYEGGFSNDATDKGGMTKYGISKHAHSEVDIENLTLEQAAGIAKKDYYDKLPLDLIPWVNVRWQIFDISFNSSPKAAVRILQRALGVTDDGSWGDKTTQVLTDEKWNEYTLCIRVMQERVKFYASLIYSEPDQIKFLKGWMRRGTDAGLELL
jgi:lysozyme family protein